MISWFKKRFNTPVEERNYGPMYAVLSVLLFAGTLWAVYDEVDARRPWKDYQQEFRDLKVKVLQQRGRDALRKVNRGDLDTINKHISGINRELASGEAGEAKKQVDELALEIRSLSQERANVKSEADNRNYLFEHSLREGHKEDAEGYRKERTEMEVEMARLDVILDSLDKARIKLQKEKIDPLLSQRKELEARKDTLYGTIEDLKTAILDARGAPIAIRQVMMNDFERSNFGRLQMRADRCQTCHLGIGDPVLSDTAIFSKVGPGQIFRNKKAADRARKVFGPHPNPEMLNTHKVEQFGCASCHGGQPNSVDDVEHAHGFQAHWERPLLTGAFVQASCRKCHEGSYDFSSMKQVADGRKLFVDFGCFGCHDGPMVPDWKEYKTGPSLRNIAKKVSADWMFRWIENPQAWNEHTRMPNFMFNDEQTEAVVAYLMSMSKDSDYKPVSSGPVGDPARGAMTMQEVGCLACHTIDGFEARGAFKFTPASGKDMLWPNSAKAGNRVGEGNNYGPDLNKVGSKVSREWLFDWLKNPDHYNPSSRMPSLRLSDQEAADVASYLMTKRDPAQPAGKTLTHLNDPKWVERGGALIREYGCFGCHDIKGMEEEGKVSVALNDFGAKAAADLYFGYVGEGQLHGVRSHFEKSGFALGKIHQHLENGEDWFTWTALKMKNPRVFATDAIPQKMPVFNMSDEEAYAMTVALRSFTRSYIPTNYKDPSGQLQPVVDDGRFLAHWHNCVGCHTVEGHGGYVLDILRTQLNMKGDDILPYGPPSLNSAGSKIQEPWFYNFVHDPSSRPVRTWLKIRMPTYGFSARDISRLDKYFLGADDETLQFTDYSFFPATAVSVEAGRQLFEKLKCQQCHAVGSSPANGGDAAVPAPNLALAGNRIKPDWIMRWLSDPQAIVRGSKMPNFFGTVDEPMPADPDILGGDRRAQLIALRDYVWRIGGPKGMGRSDTAAMSAPLPVPVAQQPKTDSTGKISMR